MLKAAALQVAHASWMPRATRSVLLSALQERFPGCDALQLSGLDYDGTKRPEHRAPRALIEVELNASLHHCIVRLQDRHCAQPLHQLQDSMATRDWTVLDTQVLSRATLDWHTLHSTHHGLQRCKVPPSVMSARTGNTVAPPDMLGSPAQSLPLTTRCIDLHGRCSIEAGLAPGTIGAEMVI